ncbi:DUF317 domain-containing protein [Kitasatospora sp. NPDC059599]|uniref:DUF317 domain-containing protein n=1 Tax=Kitasatospora sp. NPDC059599 TaxID=3346880 RepID=UPI0036C79220
MTTTNPYWATKARDQPWLQLSITPAMYAGPGPDTERAIRPLIEAGAVRAGDGRGNQFVISADGRVRLGFEPEGGSDVMWKIAVHDAPFEPPQWTVCLTEQTPVEIVEAITTDLASRLRSGRQLHGAASDREWRELVQTPEWTTTWDARRGTETVASVHDAQDRILLTAGSSADDWAEAGQDGFWTVTIGDEYDGWCAAASTSTPDRILHTVTSAMLAPATRNVTELDDLTVGDLVIGAAEVTELSSPPTPLDVRRATAARTRSRPSPAPGDRAETPAPLTSRAVASDTATRTGARR